MLKIFSLFSSLLVVSVGVSQELTIPQIMQGEEFVGHLPEDLQMMPDGTPIFSWKDKEDEYRGLYKAIDDVPVRLTDREELSFPLWGYEWNEDRTKAVYAYQGNLFIWQKDKDYPAPLIINSDYIHGVGWAGEDIYFTQKDNVYLYSCKKGTLTQLSNFQKSQAPRSSEPDFLERQQEELFEYIQPNEAGQDYGMLPQPVYLGESSLRNVIVDPTGEYYTYSQVTSASVAYTEVQHHVTADGYSSTSKARPKVGRKDGQHDFYIYEIGIQENTKVDFSSLTNLNQVPMYYSEYDDKEDSYTNKGLIFHGPYYNSTGHRAVLEIKSLDNKHRWIVELDYPNASFKEIDYQHDEAWIGGPGISGWNEVPGNIGWVNDEVLYFQSEASGYSHLYTYDFESGKKEQITSGEFEIHKTIDYGKEGELLVVANKKHPGNREVYRLYFKGKQLIPVMTSDGKHDIVTSSGYGDFYYLYSFKNQPTELFHRAGGKKITNKAITHSTTEAFESYSWYEPEVVKFMSIDALYDVHARVYQPEPDKKNGAGVIFVHGAGYLQNAHNYWSLYYREYMFHNFLRDQGYTVLDIDYRASEGYGKYWRTAIYRHMGGKDLLDQMAGREYLIDELGIDENRVGIYGGSYGGFITLMALLTEPGKFACGAALRSVTDWAHYNHEYTSNILNTPGEDSASFYRSSPINFAENLEDPLIMLHGMVDDNVQFQDVVRLSQRFIELGKENWEMAVYPVEPHGFKTASSWTDEYSRIYKLFETYLIEE
jgi:acetyl esterase/lipase